MITFNFIYKVCEAFILLNYHEKKTLNFEEFEKKAIYTLTHCKTLSSTITVINNMNFCIKKWKKIEKMFLKKQDDYTYIFNSLLKDFKKEKSLLKLVSDEDSHGSYIITNGLYNKVNDIVVAVSYPESEIYNIEYKKKKYTFYEDYDYYIKHSKFSSKVMVLYDKNDNCLCKTELNELFLSTKKNKLKYEIVDNGDFISIYDKEYVNSLSDPEKADTDKRLADFEWDVIKKGSKLCAARLNVYSEEIDLEIAQLFTLSAILNYSSIIEHRELMRVLLIYYLTKD